MVGRNGHPDVTDVVVDLHHIVRFCSDRRIQRKLLDLADELLQGSLDESDSYVLEEPCE